MKWIAIIAVCLAVLLYLFQRSEVGLEQREDGLYYKASAETAFTGNGVVYHSNRQKAQEGEIEQGKPVGLWKIWHANGQLSREGSYKDGKKDGQGTYSFPNGKKAVGVFRNNRPWNIIEYNKNGNIIGKFINGKKQ